MWQESRIRQPKNDLQNWTKFKMFFLFSFQKKKKKHQISQDIQSSKYYG